MLPKYEWYKDSERFNENLPIQFRALSWLWFRQLKLKGEK